MGHNYEVGQAIQLTAPGQGPAPAPGQGLGPSPCLFAVFEKHEMNQGGAVIVGRTHEKKRKGEGGALTTGPGPGTIAVVHHRWVNRGLTHDMIRYHSNLHGREELPGGVVSEWIRL